MAELMRRWEQVLTYLEDDPRRLDGQLDWVTKYNLLDAYAAKNGLEWGDPKLALMDLQYHDVRPERSLYEKLVSAGKVERMLVEDEVVDAITETKAYTADAAGVQAYMDEMLAFAGTDVSAVPKDAPVRIVSLRAAALLSERLAGDPA